jgi:hypothetical protein
MCINNFYDRIADGLGYVMSFYMIYKIIPIIFVNHTFKVSLIASRTLLNNHFSVNNLPKVVCF